MSNLSKDVFFTKYTSTSSPLSKEYSLENEKIEKNAAASMHKGTAECVTIPFEEFANALIKGNK